MSEATWRGGATTIEHTDELVQWFEKACRPDGHLIGTEQEKFGLYLSTVDGEADVPTPVRYREHVLPTLEGLRDRFGWRESKSRGIHGELIALERDGASITLEPGGQFELSGAPLPTVHDTCAEFSTHYDELHAVAEPMGVAWIASGFHPFATRGEIDVMPKGRYAVMKSYLPTKGERALDMMFRTCTVQANFDYRDEAQCGLRLRMIMGISGLITALFANSPYVEGEHRGTRSMRSATWEHVDPDRCGLLPFVFEPDFSWQRYVDWALDVPMFFVYRGGRYNAHHVPFRRFLAEGYTDEAGTTHRATQADWELHLSTLFPEVRIKPFIEIRGADSVGSKTVCALPALCKGILYDDDAREGAWELVANLDFAGRMDLWKRGRTDGLSDPEVLDKCRKLLTLARGGLERLDVRDSKGRTEARFLDALDAQVERGATPAGDVLARLGPKPGRGKQARLELVRNFHFAGKHF
ncbi:glutamate--cysteine ligase [Plesiocystis pacifica SIR-1]|uniref:Glutamate--cysteine ligase n=1 Tax=Plesiocystis pacifica SIR-1 TaxID=391625 RepID=A6GCK2_9BACT|nr:glutamate-cysteine ligase family protein [Plesiocystis pacifica]EDM76459.1 glutamate--cysteine ligase [Plesiocystis pacifica SIR-1]